MRFIFLFFILFPTLTFSQVKQKASEVRYKGLVVNPSGTTSPGNVISPTCSDGVQNGNETGIDCGGDCSPCPTCSDGIQNGDETGVDCGGSCQACTAVGGEIVPTADMPELRFYVTSEEQTGADGSAITAITDLSANPAPINTITGVTVNVSATGQREFDFGAAGAFFEWGQPAKLDFQKATDDITMLVVLGERRDPNNVGALIYKGDLSVGQGEFSLITSQADGIYTRTWSGGGCCASTKEGGNLIPYDVVAVTAAVTGASTTNRIYFNGIEATATTNYTHGADAVFNTDWRSGVEWNQGATAFEYDGTILAIMIFEKILTPTEMINIRTEILGGPVAPTCSDGVQNGNETGVDCGGSCAACPAEPTCSDGVQNGNETGIDCGGDCSPCDAPASCSDGIQNGDEIAIDCGGSCAACDITPPAYTECTGGGGGTYVPSSWADITDPARTGQTAIITNNISYTSGAPAPGQAFDPNGGIISGSGINLGDVCIQDEYSQLFASNVTFSSRYNASRLSPEAFGANGADTANDAPSLITMFNNCDYAIGQPGSIYAMNQHYHDTGRANGGAFNWDLNGAHIEVTSNSLLDSGINKIYLLRFDNTDLVLYSSTTPSRFDANNLFGKGLWMNFGSDFYIANINARDWQTNVVSNAEPFKFDLYTNLGFDSGEMYNCVIENIFAAGTGTPNQAGSGIAKGVSIYPFDVSQPASVIFQGNRIRNISGDDAEALLISPARGGMTHPVTFTLNGEDYRAAGRRILKITESNVTITNSHFEASPTQLSPFGVVAVAAFGTQGSDLMRNFVFTNNTITVPNPNIMKGFAINEVRNAVVTDNVITFGDLGNQCAFQIGGGGAGYVGAYENCTFARNTIVNSFIQVTGWYSPPQGVTFDDFTFDITYNQNVVGADVALIRYLAGTGSHTDEEFRLTNSDVTINFPIGFSGWKGIFTSNSPMDIQGLVLENVTVNYTAGLGLYSLGYAKGNFDATNRITNVTMTGATGTGAIRVDGVSNVAITNSTGNGVPITVQ